MLIGGDAVKAGISIHALREEGDPMEVEQVG